MCSNRKFNVSQFLRVQMAGVYAAILLAFALNPTAAKAALYGATASGTAGQLYIIDPATAAVVQDVGPLNDTNGVNYPITGMAFHPTTGVLYGSTGNNPASTAGLLVTINPANAVVTVVGLFNAGPVNGSGTPCTMGDIAFDSAGNLYGVGTIGGPQLYSIDHATGQATVVGSTELTSTTGGGLAISSSGVFFGTPTSTRFGTYDPTTGIFSNIANPTKPGGGGAYAALAFDGNGVLYGLNSAPGTPPPTYLATIDTATGAVTSMGQAVQAMDAIAFSPAIAVSPTLSIIRTGSDVVISWSDTAGFQLETNAVLTSGTWSTNTPAPVLSNGTNSVTFPATGSASFFRLRKP